MGYYQGDFYRGDYYGGTRGDPFLGGLFSKVIGVGKSLLGLGGGSSAGAITKAVESGIQRAIPSFPGVGKVGAIVKKGVGVVKAHPVLTGAGAAGIIGAAGAGAARMLGGGGGKKRRRMNPCNARALRRAIRRASSFERLAKRVIGFSSPRKPHGRMYFKKRRRKA